MGKIPTRPLDPAPGHSWPVASRASGRARGRLLVPGQGGRGASSGYKRPTAPFSASSALCPATVEFVCPAPEHGSASHGEEGRVRAEGPRRCGGRHPLRAEGKGWGGGRRPGGARAPVPRSVRPAEPRPHPPRPCLTARQVRAARGLGRAASACAPSREVLSHRAGSAQAAVRGEAWSGCYAGASAGPAGKERARKSPPSGLPAARACRPGRDLTLLERLRWPFLRVISGPEALVLRVAQRGLPLGSVGGEGGGSSIVDSVKTLGRCFSASGVCRLPQ